MYGLNDKEKWLYGAIQNGDSATGVFNSEFMKSELLQMMLELRNTRIVNEEQKNRLTEMQRTIQELEDTVVMEITYVGAEK